MKCPYCSNNNSKVTNKRESPEGIRRRRECLKCKKRFTTYEKYAENNLYITKKDKRREKFDSCKLRKGVDKACEKRPMPTEKIDKMVAEIEEIMRRKGKKEIQSSVIGELVMRKLKKLDEVAYIRFASVYRDFKHIKDFKKEIKDL